MSKVSYYMECIYCGAKPEHDRYEGAQKRMVNHLMRKHLHTKEQAEEEVYHGMQVWVKEI